MARGYHIRIVLDNSRDPLEINCNINFRRKKLPQKTIQMDLAMKQCHNEPSRSRVTKQMVKTPGTNEAHLQWLLTLSLIT